MKQNPSREILGLSSEGKLSAVVGMVLLPLFGSWPFATGIVSHFRKESTRKTLPTAALAWPDALRFVPAVASSSSFAADFAPALAVGRFLGFLPEPMTTGAPGSSSQSGQNHSPSGTASSGGSRQCRWYGLSHYTIRRVRLIARSHTDPCPPFHTQAGSHHLRCPYCTRRTAPAPPCRTDVEGGRTTSR